MSKRTRFKLTIFFIVLTTALSVTGIAVAQSSINYDLACWGTLTSGGGTRQSPTFALKDAAGLWSSGVSNSPSVSVRSGFAQNWTVPSTATNPPQPAGDDRLFMPLIKHVVRIVRDCAF